MTNMRVAIIGAGLSGLAAGCYARMNDHQAIIFDQLGWPGGLARSWNREGFRMDPGPDLIWGHEQGTSTHVLLRELGVFPRRGVSPVRWGVTDEKGQRKVEITSPLKDLERELKRMAPADVDLIEDAMDACSSMEAGGLLDTLASVPSDLGGLSTSLSVRWKERRYLSYLRGAWTEPMAEWSERFQDPFLQRMMSSLCAPESPAWLGMAMLSLATKGELARLDDGADGLVGSLVDRYMSLGGRFGLRSMVKEIVVEGDEVKGLRLSDGTTEEAERVITASDVREVIYRMLDRRFLDDEIERRHREWKPSTPQVSVSIGTSRPMEGLLPMATVLLDSPLAMGTTPNLSMLVRSYDSSGGYAPAGKGLVCATLKSDWQFWYKLRALDRRMYEEEKARVGGEILKRLELLLPGLSQETELVEVSTPFSAWKVNLGHEGAPSGWSLTEEAMSSRTIRTLPGLKGLYMAGPWAVPALGTQGCMFTGKHAVQKMCHDEGRAFKAIAPLG
ncbi:MAG: FAD-dependent oxidoreductase [Methanomassiliicoccales archaeon]|nr:FAD-dependent oxidoreductase [Methanomassiliicoccales archaeon]